MSRQNHHFITTMTASPSHSVTYLYFNIDERSQTKIHSASNFSD